MVLADAFNVAGALRNQKCFFHVDGQRRVSVKRVMVNIEVLQYDRIVNFISTKITLLAYIESYVKIT